MSRDRPITGVPLWLAVAGATMGQTFVLPGVTVADLGLALAAGIVTVLLVRGRLDSAFPRWSLVVALWFGWSLLGGGVRFLSSPLSFSGVEFLKSLAKLGFYGVGAWLLALLLRHMTEERVKDLVLWVLTVNAAIALYIYLVMTTGWDLPYRFFWIGSQDTVHALSWGAAAFDEPLVRARGLAGEPSYFGLFQLLGLAVAYGGSSFGVQGHRWREALVLITVVLTFSLGVYLLLSVFLLAVGWLALRRGRPVVRRVVIPGLLVVLALVAVPKIQESTTNLVAYRLAMATSGSPDTSVKLRAIVNFRIAWEIVQEAPVFGAGLGNFDVAWKGIRPRLGAASQFPPEQGWNGLLYAVATTGVVGGLLFMLLLLEVWRANPLGGVVLVAALFATSAILAAPFWLVLVLLTVPGGVPRRR